MLRFRIMHGLGVIAALAGVACSDVTPHPIGEPPTPPGTGGAGGTSSTGSEGGGGMLATGGGGGAGGGDAFGVLVFTDTEDFRHPSIPAGVQAITELGEEHGFFVEALPDDGLLTAGDLDRMAVVVFLNTEGEVLDMDERQALKAFIQGGGGYVGIHGGADAEYTWPWYGELVGAWLDNHPPGTQEASLEVVDPSHSSTSHLPAIWLYDEQWYNFRTNPTRTVNVLINVDESTYSGGTMGDPHPIAWFQEVEGGRSWYTCMGHASATFAEPLFRQHLAAGIVWAATGE
jgi:type 1 glutamine amidotransferase